MNALQTFDEEKLNKLSSLLDSINSIENKNGNFLINFKKNVIINVEENLLLKSNKNTIIIGTNLHLNPNIEINNETDLQKLKILNNNV